MLSPARFTISLLHRGLYRSTILKPTRITQRNSTLIDSIFTNTLSDIIDSAILVDDMSDNLPIYVQIRNSAAETTYKKRLVSDQIIRNFVGLVTDADWTDRYKTSNGGNANIALYPVY